jgi:hypothetical protein
MYPDSDKLLFSSTVHGASRRWDPLAVRRNLIRAAKGKLGALLTAAADRKEPEQVEGQPPPLPLPPEPPEELIARLDAQERLANVLREAFDLPGLDAGEDAVAHPCGW